VTDHDGGFSFRGLTAGDYRVVIQGTNDYETNVESADIYRESSPGGVNKLVNIQLRAKPGGALDPLSDVPQAARERYISAQVASKKNDTAKAVEELTAALAIKPDFKAALNELGMQYLKLNQSEKASEMFKKAVKLAPEEYTPKVNYGLALYSQRKFEDAQIELQQAVKINKALPSAHLYLGMTYVGLKKFDEAQKEFETTISSGGDNLGQAHRYLGGLFAKAGKHKQAAIELEKYLKLTPNAPDSVQAQAMIKDLRSKQ
jgi:tetratricopeptide (TPR) repeat protein